MAGPLQGTDKGLEAMQGRLQIPEAWRELLSQPLSGTILVVGATDSGKTTLVRHLVTRLRRSGSAVGWLDGDIGQSTLGLPATQTLALIDRAAEGRPRVAATFFVGATSPRGHMLPVLTGLARLHRRALQRGAQAVVVDTTGLVSAETGGGALKQWLAELLRPEFVIALQRGDELEHLLRPWRREQRFALHILPVPEAVRLRSREERSRYRRRLFRRYFSAATEREIPLEAMALYGKEWVRPGSLAGLQGADGLSLALGVLKEALPHRLRMVTPLSAAVTVKSIRCATLRLDPHSGEELPP